MAAPGWGGISHGLSVHMARGYLAENPTLPFGSRSERDLVPQDGAGKQVEGDHHAVLLSFVRMMWERAIRSTLSRSVRPNLRAHLRVRALLREVCACSVRGFGIDRPRSVLDFDRTREVLAKVAAERLRVATDFVRELLRRHVLDVCHDNPLPFIRLHMRSVSSIVRSCAFERKTYVKRSMRTHRSFVVRSLIDRSQCNYHPPAALAKGPCDVSSLFVRA